VVMFVMVVACTDQPNILSFGESYIDCEVALSLMVTSLSLSVFFCNIGKRFRPFGLIGALIAAVVVLVLLRHAVLSRNTVAILLAMSLDIC